jgi:hypothetical protein
LEDLLSQADGFHPRRFLLEDEELRRALTLLTPILVTHGGSLAYFVENELRPSGRLLLFPRNSWKIRSPKAVFYGMLLACRSMRKSIPLIDKGKPAVRLGRKAEGQVEPDGQVTEARAPQGPDL